MHSWTYVLNNSKPDNMKYINYILMVTAVSVISCQDKKTEAPLNSISVKIQTEKLTKPLKGGEVLYAGGLVR